MGHTTAKHDIHKFQFNVISAISNQYPKLWSAMKAPDCKYDDMSHKFHGKFSHLKPELILIYTPTYIPHGH